MEVVREKASSYCYDPSLPSRYSGVEDIILRLILHRQEQVPNSQCQKSETTTYVTDAPPLTTGISSASSICGRNYLLFRRVAVYVNYRYFHPSIHWKNSLSLQVVLPMMFLVCFPCCPVWQKVTLEPHSACSAIPCKV